MTLRRRGAEAAPPERAALQRERQDLLARLQQIDRELGTQRETAVVRPPERRG